MKKALMYVTASILMLVVISTNIRAVEATQASGCGISLKSTEYSVVFATAFATDNGVTCRCDTGWFPNKDCLANNRGSQCAPNGSSNCQEFNINCGGINP